MPARRPFIARRGWRSSWPWPRPTWRRCARSSRRSQAGRRRRDARGGGGRPASASRPCGVAVYAPVRAPRQAAADRYARKRDDTDATAAWRARMATEDAHRIYKERAATAETLHADQRAWRGFTQLPVRGLRKAWCIALWAALLHNILRADVLLRGGS